MPQTPQPRRWPLYVAGFIAILTALLAGYTWLTLSWSYSEGERAGYVQKFSKKGWLCKTWEGELAMVSMPGTLAEKFFFSVRNEGRFTRNGVKFPAVTSFRVLLRCSDEIKKRRRNCSRRLGSHRAKRRDAFRT